MLCRALSTALRRRCPPLRRPAASASATPPRPKVLLLAGPTASGKSALSLALAKALNGEVISADSVQVYRGLDVGSAKLSLRQRQGVPHHLLDVLPADGEMSAGDWADAAAAAAADCVARGVVPIVVGGTGFYLRWLTSGKPNTPRSSAAAAAAARAELQAAQAAAEAATPGLADGELAALRWEAAAAVLAGAGDSETAARLARNDYYRLERALEIVRATGQPVSAFAAPSTEEAPSNFDFRAFHLAVPRLLLYRRIDARCEAMLAGGLLREAAWLWAAGARPAVSAGDDTPPAARSIGYAQALALLQRLSIEGGGCAAAALDACLADMQRASRNYAKRQATWFRGEPSYRWVHAADPGAALEEILREFDAPEHTPCAAAADAPGVSPEHDRPLHRALVTYQTQRRLFQRPFVRSAVVRWLQAWAAREQEAAFGAPRGALSALPTRGASWRVRRCAPMAAGRRRRPLLRLRRSPVAALVAAEGRRKEEE